MTEIEKPGVANRRLVISITIGILCICFAFYIYFTVESESDIAVIGKDTVTGISKEAGLIAFVSFIFGFTLIIMTTVFYLGWRHEYYSKERKR